MAMKPRERRLDNEHREMRELAQSSSLIAFVAHGAPPARYDIAMICRGMRKFGDRIMPTSDHRIEITLDDNFPLLPPTVVWRTPIFHPNIKPPYVCSGDIWYPAMSLADFCIELCEMVQYKSFNIYSVLNDEAAEWAWQILEFDPASIPTDPRTIRDLDFSVSVNDPPDTEGS